jgi:cytochrome P450
LGTFPETMQEPFMQPQFRWWKSVGDEAALIHETEILGDSTILCLDKTLVNMVFTGSAFGGKGGNATTSRFHMARNYIKEIAGASIFTVEDADWARHRRILQPAFASRALKDTVSASIPSKVNRLIDCWKRASANDRQREIDATSHLSALALDVIGHVAFSHDFHGMDALEEWSKNQDTMSNSAAATPQLANIDDKFLVAITALSQAVARVCHFRQAGAVLPLES